METQSLKVEILSDKDMEWFVEIAATRMLIEELKRPEYVDTENLYALASMGAMTETAFVVKQRDVPVGALGAIVVPNVYNPKLRNLVEMFWYVLPEYRKGRAGLMLLNAYNVKAAELGHETTLSLLPSSNINEKTLNKKGFRLVEYAYRKD